MSPTEVGPTPLLFHGPTSQNRATLHAQSWGRLVGTFGDPDKGLDAETVREASTAARSVPVGDGRSSIVVGPVDVGTSAGVIDPLLKILEEPGFYFPRVHLWAWDEGEVRPTVRSRVLSEWCPGRYPVNMVASKAARESVRAVLRGDTGGVLDVLTGVREGWRDLSPWFLRAASAELAQVLASPETLPVDWRRGVLLWGRLRPLIGARNVSWYETVAGVVP